ncbi:hypothetical protein QYE76_042173 [Lolium multiflorum]|uniref:Uncharacterized protein n=1 Tax=Lolium multiflorum TaxID=4521 RepID=A0AAD8TEW4_LOLMU|nr:hypothetical protein QYE76_042173 [Lolium multiflorum]
MQAHKRIRTDEAVSSTNKLVVLSLQSFGQDRFIELPDDLLITVLAKVAYGASSPADQANTRMTFSRFKKIAHNSEVLKNASASCIAVSAKKWSHDAEHFLKSCADAREHERGTDLIADAALQSNSYAIYSLAVIMFNGSGGTGEDRNIRVSVSVPALQGLVTWKRFASSASLPSTMVPTRPTAFFQSGSQQGTSSEGSIWTMVIQQSSNFYHAAILDVVVVKFEDRSSTRAPAAARLSTVLKFARQHTGRLSTESLADRWNKVKTEVIKPTHQSMATQQQMKPRGHLMSERDRATLCHLLSSSV